MSFGGAFGLARTEADETQVLVLRVVAALFGAAGGCGLLVVPFVRHDVPHPVVMAIASVCAIACCAVLLVLAARATPLAERRYLLVVVMALAAAIALLATAQYSTGPRAVVAMLVAVEVAVFAFYLLRLPAAFVTVAAVGGAFTVVFVIQDGYLAPPAQLLYLTGTLVATGLTFRTLLTLGIEESSKLDRLRRFLAPQVADLVLSGGSEALLAPHRCQIAVLFCDLRGFTSFAAAAEPEDIIDVLNEYYEGVGAILREAEATVGTFAGDGIMAYFNDPVRCDDPAWKAVEVALRLRGPLDRLSAAWASRGHELGYGVGVAYGYATLGAVGFEGRNDYTALGSVVNLAARLCDGAASGQILIDQRVFHEAGERLATQPHLVHAKGFHDPVPAYVVVGPPDATTSTSG